MAKMSIFYNNGLVLKTAVISNGIVKELLTIGLFFFFFLTLKIKELPSLNNLLIKRNNRYSIRYKWRVNDQTRSSNKTFHSLFKKKKKSKNLNLDIISYDFLDIY